MSGFRVRIELEGASQGDYVLLQRRLEAAGYHRADTSATDGRRSRFAIAVPVYECETAAEADEVRDQAKRIADSVTRGGHFQVTPVDAAHHAACG
jgi:hypothetical protein